MNIPDFNAEASLNINSREYVTITTTRKKYSDSSKVIELSQLFGGFGPTLPTCHWEKTWIDCGSPLPGFPTPKCFDWIYICKFPGSSRNALFQ